MPKWTKPKNEGSCFARNSSILGAIMLDFRAIGLRPFARRLGALSFFGWWENGAARSIQ
jgi:hypothetical protein